MYYHLWEWQVILVTKLQDKHIVTANISCSSYCNKQRQTTFCCKRKTVFISFNPGIYIYTQVHNHRIIHIYMQLFIACMKKKDITCKGCISFQQNGNQALLPSDYILNLKKHCQIIFYAKRNSIESYFMHFLTAKIFSEWNLCFKPLSIT